MKVLVTGAHGMVGRNLLADPRAAEHYLYTPRRDELDLTKACQCGDYVEHTSPDAIVHLAAVVGGIQANIDEPVRFTVENVRMAMNIFEAAHACGVPAFLNVASSCMYPKDWDTPLVVDDLLGGPLEPTNEGYALSKILSWKLGTYIRRENPGLMYKTIVPCNLFGRFDHFDPIKSHLVPAAIVKIMGAIERGDPEVQIWGDGTARREFMYASDLADFIWTWLPHLNRLDDVMNVGVGYDYSVEEYYKAIAEISGYRGGFLFDKTRPVGMRRKLLDVSAQEALGWRPTTSLRDGLAATIAYYKNTASH